MSFHLDAKFTLPLLYVSWAMPTIAFVTAPSYLGFYWYVTMAFIVTVLLVFYDRKLISHAVPFCAFLSPLVFDEKFFGLYYSEVLIVLALVISVTQVKEFLSYRKRDACNLLIILYLLLLTISYTLSNNLRPLILGYINGLIFVFIYFRLILDIKSLQEIRAFFVTLVVASLFASLLMISSFLSGISLQNFVDPEFSRATALAVTAGYNNETYDIKASFFYTNIYFVLASVLFMVPFIFWRTPYSIVSHKTLGLVVGLVILISLVLYFNKAVLLAFLLTFSVYIFTWKSSQGSRLFFLVATAFTMSALLALLLTINPQVLKLISLVSLQVRLDLVDSVAQVFSEHPWRLFFGFGPESLTRMPEGSDGGIFTMAKTTAVGTEGTIDSTFLGFLFEYGFLAFAILGTQGYRIAWSLIRQIYDSGSSEARRQWSLLFLAIFVCIFITAIVQVIGMSKVAWVLGQIFGCLAVFLHISRQGDLDEMELHASSR